MDLKNLFNKIDESMLTSFIKEKKEENLYIEFKTISGAKLSRDDRKNFAKALSGFANSSGGLLIWGIEARKNREGIDCAIKKEPIDSLSLLISKLNEYTGEVVSPNVEGVHHKKILIGNDKGFAVTIVPESDMGPHMANAGETRYFKRSGDSFYKMEHFDIEDMFGRRKNPKLSLYNKLEKIGSNSDSEGKYYTCSLVVGIENNGRGTAKYPYISMLVNKPYIISTWGLDGNGNTGLPMLPSSSKDAYFRFGGSADNVIHSNSILEITKINFQIRENKSGFKDIKIEADISAEDMRMMHTSITINAIEILKLINGA